MSDRTISTGQAAKELGIGHVTLLRWMHRGYVTPAWRTPAGQYRWIMADLQHQLDQPRPAARHVSEPQGEPMPDPTTPLHPAIAVAIVTSSHGVLVERRHDGRPPWTFPSGEIEPGEAPADTAVRETKEECSLSIVVSHVIGERNPHPLTGRHTIYLAARPYHGTEIHNGDENENAEVKWVSLADAEQLMPTMYDAVHEHLAATLSQVRHRYSA